MTSPYRHRYMLTALLMSLAAFVVGGGQIYRWAMPLADRIYLTRVGIEVEGDVTFPELPEGWERVSSDPREAEEFNYVFEVWENRDVPIN